MTVKLHIKFENQSNYFRKSYSRTSIRDPIHSTWNLQNIVKNNIVHGRNQYHVILWKKKSRFKNTGKILWKKYYRKNNSMFLSIKRYGVVCNNSNNINISILVHSFGGSQSLSSSPLFISSISPQIYSFSIWSCTDDNFFVFHHFFVIIFHFYSLIYLF